MPHRMNEIKPVHYVTKKECQEMIDNAIRQHNRNASIISMTLGIIFLALFVDGFFRVIGMIPPFMGIDVNILHEVIDRVKGEIFQVLIEIDSLKTSKSRLVGLEMEFQQGSFWQGPIRGILSIAAWFRVSTSVHFVGGADSADDRLPNCN